MHRLLVFLLFVLVAVPATALAGGSSAQQDAAHTGSAEGPGAPLGKRWERDLGASAGSPLVADGRAFVVSGAVSSSSSSGAPSPQLRALALDSGAELWARAVNVSDQDAQLAYDGGRVFVFEDGLIKAFDAASGSLAWTARASSANNSTKPAFTSVPVALGGVVYVTGTSPPNTPAPLPVTPAPTAPRPYSLYALRASDGAVQRTSELAIFADSTVPRHAVAADDARVYVTAGCATAQAFDRASGESRWNRQAPSGSGSSSNGSRSCTGRATAPPAAAGGDLFVVSESAYGGSSYVVRDAASGDERGTVAANSAVALGGGLALLPQSGALVAQARPSGLTSWTWRPQNSYDGPSGPSLIAGGTVYTRQYGFLVALGQSNGAEQWRGYVRYQYASGSSSETARSLAAGGGHLLVPNGSILTAFWNGPDSPGLSSKPPLGPGAVGFEASATDVVYGREVELSGRLNVEDARPDPGSREVLLQADPWPHEGTFETVATTVAKSESFSFSVKPERNTVYRAVAPAFSDGLSKPVEVRSDFGVVFPRPRVKGRKVRVRVRIFHSPQQALAGRKMHIYLVRGRRATRKATRRIRRVSDTEAKVAATYRTRPRRNDITFICIKEPVEDGYGRRLPVDPHCGKRILSRRVLP